MASAASPCCPITDLLAPIFVGENWLPCNHLCPLPASSFPPKPAEAEQVSSAACPSLWSQVRTTNPSDEQPYLQTVYTHFEKWPLNTEESHRQLLWLESNVVRSGRTTELLLNWSLGNRVKLAQPIKEPSLRSCPTDMPPRAYGDSTNEFPVASLQVTPHQGEFAGT